MQTERVKRPVGVTVIAVWNIVAAVFLGLVLLAAMGEETGDPAAAAFGGAFVAGLVALILVVAVGLLRLRNWARITATIMYGLNALSAFIELVMGNPVALFGLGIALTILIYLNREHVREAFTSTGRIHAETTPSSPFEALEEQSQSESRAESAHY